MANGLGEKKLKNSFKGKETSAVCPKQNRDREKIQKIIKATPGYITCLFSIFYIEADIENRFFNNRPENFLMTGCANDFHEKTR